MNENRLKLPPKWALRRLELLWEKFKDKEFSYDDASSSLKDDDPRMVSQVLSRLSRINWISIRKEAGSPPKAFYKITNPKVVEVLVKEIKF